MLTERWTVLGLQGHPVVGMVFKVGKDGEVVLAFGQTNIEIGGPHERDR